MIHSETLRAKQKLTAQQRPMGKVTWPTEKNYVQSVDSSTLSDNENNSHIDKNVGWRSVRGRRIFLFKVELGISALSLYWWLNPANRDVHSAFDVMALKQWMNLFFKYSNQLAHWKTQLTGMHLYDFFLISVLLLIYEGKYPRYSKCLQLLTRDFDVHYFISLRKSDLLGSRLSCKAWSFKKHQIYPL